jgi:hypothetical protein
MAIDTSCPSCSKRYKLKDELAGKRVTCGNPNCRKAFVVPAASANGHARAAPPPVDAEALAALAFAEDVEQQVPVDQRRVKMTCVVCEAKWEEPWDRQGKNVLCPECKHRQKVPEQKTGKVDWRDPKAGRPTLAKVEELEGVQASTDASHAGFESLKKAGVIEDNVEPRPRWHYVAWVAIPLLALGLATYAGVLIFQSTKESNHDEAMRAAVAGLLADPGDLPAGEAPLFRGAIQIAAGEYFIRRADGREPRNAAIDYFANARTELDGAPPSPGRDVLLGELAVAQVQLGGGPDEVGNETRIRWVPGGKTTNEKQYDVQKELQSTLTRMKNDKVSYEVRVLTMRRLAHELAKKGQPGLLQSQMAFLDNEQLEADAWMAAEAARGGGGDLDEAVTKIITGLNAPAELPAGQVSDGTRLAHTARFLLKKDMAEALALARRAPGEPDGRVKALALVAEWGDEATAAEAVRDAKEVVAGITAKQARPSDYTLVRLAQAAGRTKQPDLAEAFVKAVNKDDYRAWAQAEALRAALAADGAAADEKRAAVPDNPKDVRVAHAWGRLALARHNARVTGSDAGLKPFDLDRWGPSFKPFGQAGLILGLQDHAAK